MGRKSFKVDRIRNTVLIIQNKSNLIHLEVGKEKLEKVKTKLMITTIFQDTHKMCLHALIYAEKKLKRIPLYMPLTLLISTKELLALKEDLFLHPSNNSYEFYLQIKTFTITIWNFHSHLWC